MELKADDLATAMQNALPGAWTDIKGGTFPGDPNDKDQQLLFRAIARGLFTYLKANQDALIEIIGLTDGVIHLAYTVEALDLGADVPLIQVGPTTISANASSGNVLQVQGNLYGTPSFDATVEFGLEASAAGLLATVTTGARVLAQDIAVDTKNRFAVYPADFALRDGVHKGEQMTVVYRNITAAALSAFTRVKLTPA